MRTIWRNTFSRKIKTKFERSGNEIDFLCKIALCYDFSVGVRRNLLGGRDWGEMGAVAQLGERFNGIEEVEGSNPSSSTTYYEVLQQQGIIRTHYPDLDARHAWPASVMVLAARAR